MTGPIKSRGRYAFSREFREQVFGPEDEARGSEDDVDFRPLPARWGEEQDETLDGEQ